MVKPLSQEMQEKKTGFGKVDRELTCKCREMEGSIGLPSEDTQSYIMLELRWEVGLAIAEICNICKLRLLVSAPRDLQHGEKSAKCSLKKRTRRL